MMAIGQRWGPLTEIVRMVNYGKDVTGAVSLSRSGVIE